MKALQSRYLFGIFKFFFYFFYICFALLSHLRRHRHTNVTLRRSSAVTCSWHAAIKLLIAANGSCLSLFFFFFFSSLHLEMIICGYVVATFATVKVKTARGTTKSAFQPFFVTSFSLPQQFEQVFCPVNKL